MNLRTLMPFGSSTGASGNGGQQMQSRSQVPSSVFGSLHREIDRLFEDLTRSTLADFGQAQVNLVPNIDVAETDKEIVISAEMPGLERKDIDISIDDDVLTIRGEKKVERKEENKEKSYHVAERAYGVFFRAIQLPAGVDPSRIQATMSNGVLKITIPKPAKSEPKKIEVKDAA
jgi:HSP20 family protein